jgi:excisionase family DNA binding protein
MVHERHHRGNGVMMTAADSANWLDELLGDTERVPIGRLAERLKIHHDTVRRWALAGRLDARRIGSRWYVDRAGVERFLANSNPRGRQQ